MSAAAVQSRLPAPSPRLAQSKIGAPRPLAPPSPAPPSASASASSAAAHPHPLHPSGIRVPSSSVSPAPTSRLSRPTSKLAPPSSAASSIASGSYASIPSRPPSTSRIAPPTSLKEPAAGQKKEIAKPTSGLKAPSSSLTKSFIKAPESKGDVKRGLRPPSSGLKTPSSLRSPAVSPQPKPRDLPLAAAAAAAPAAPAAAKAAAPAASSSSSTANAAPEALATPPQQQKSIPAPSKMLKLFGKEKKKDEVPEIKATPISTSKLKRPGLRPPSERVIEKKPDVVPTRTMPVKTIEEAEEKRSSSTSVDSAYCELSASSSSPSTSSTSSTADVSQTMMQVSPLVDKPTSMPSCIPSTSTSSLPVPPSSRLAVPAAAAAAAEPLAPSPIAEKPTLAVKGTRIRTAEPESPEFDSPTIVEELDETAGKAAKIADVNSIPSAGPSASSSTKEVVKSIPAAPVAPVDTVHATFTTSPIPPPPPAVTAGTLLNQPRQPPSYSQLCRSGRISVPIGEHPEEPRVIAPGASASASEAATADMIRRASAASAASSAHPPRTRHANELIYTKSSNMMLQDDSSDSSSVSSTSDDFCDGASIISGTQSDYMAAAFALGRSQQTRNGRSSSMGERQRHLVDQENITALLKQCKTSKRGEAYQQPWPFAQEGTPIDLPPRLNGLASNGYAGLHSLERKSRVAQLYRDDPHYSDRSALSALVSPRRMPPPVSSSDRHSLSAGRLSCSGMSRSMVLLDEDVPSASSRTRGRVYAACASAAASPRRTRDSSRSGGGSSSARLPLSIAAPIGSLKRHENIYANAAALRDGELSLHKSSLPCSPSHSLRQSAERDFKGSQLSLASSCAFSTVDSVDVERLVRDLEGYHRKVNSLQRSNHNYEAVMDTVNRRVEKIARVVGRDDTISSDEASRLRAEIEAVRLVISRATSGGMRVTEPVQIDGLTRQPSMESVASGRSSMSTASKTSALGFGVKGQKKSWVDVQFRSSLTKAFHKNGTKKEKKDEAKEAEQVVVSHLKKQLADKECTLNDVRLDAVTAANSVQELQEQLHRLKSENQHLRSELRYQQSARSRASSRASIPVDEDICYDIPPSSSRSSASSKRSSGCGAVRVSVNVDLHGTLTTTVSPDNEISIGFVALPATDVSWTQLDQQLFAIFQEYLSRIDPENTLGLHASKSVIGYQMGEVCRYLQGKPNPASAPFETITTSSTIRMFLRGAHQQEVDSLVLSTLFPRGIADKLLKDLSANRRLLLCGATGIGKSMLARQLAALLAARMGSAQGEGVHELRMPEDAASAAQAQLALDRLLSSTAPSVILIDNVPKARMTLIQSSVAAAKLRSNEGPYVIATVNRACQSLDRGDGQTFNTFIVTSRNEGVRGFTARFLRRRLVEQEYRSCSTVPSEMLRVIDFMTTVLAAVNTFIEKANSLDVTVGPRTFCACPLSVEESRAWFVQLWNENLVPYMTKVANEGIKVLGRSVSYDDPTDTVCEAWPWVEGAPGESVLIRLLSYAQVAIKQEKPTNFNAFEALTKIRSREAETC
ncbi:unc-53 [Pristionchus pacificus]|uniref:Unc-53 n=1 Tax=Pristionchus pacificus TaxID=54126 RepID=A0A2A6CWA3_PRIPA|nr:unc-53 [Pristionchus pacificus]|eukprot:PDM82439.1 unc-53 [Pristionchus pacificus]